MKKIVKWICFSSFLILLSSCFLPVFHRNYIDRSYFGDEVDGRVIDLVTQKPISNVVVSIQWNVKFIGLWSGSNLPFYIDETVTDQNGYFKFSAWGPKQAKEDTDESSPSLAFFKEGYYYEAAHYLHVKKQYEGEKATPFSFNWRLIPKPTPLSNNKLIAMKPFDNNIQEYVENIKGFSFSLRSKLNMGCTNIPKTIGRLFKVKKQLKELLAKQGITKESKNELGIIYDNVYYDIIDFAKFESITGITSDQQILQKCPHLNTILQIISEEETSS